MRVVMGALGAARLVELVQEGKEGGHVDAAALATGLGEFDIVFNLKIVSFAVVMLSRNMMML